VLATGQSFAELAQDGRIRRVVPFWDARPPLPETWPGHLFLPAHGSNPSAASPLHRGDVQHLASPAVARPSCQTLGRIEANGPHAP
jgi:hypothetical protein